MAYEMVMPYHLHMPSYFLETFTEYPHPKLWKNSFLHLSKKRFFTSFFSHTEMHIADYQVSY